MGEIKIQEYEQKLEELIEQQFKVVSKKAPITHEMSSALNELIDAYSKITVLKLEMTKRLQKIPFINKEPKKALEQDICHFLDKANWSDNIEKGDISNPIAESIQYSHATVELDKER